MLGEYPSKNINHELPLYAHNLKNTLTQAGLNLKILDNLYDAQWTKLAVNLPFFGLMLYYGINQALIIKEHYSELLLLQAEMYQGAKLFGCEIDVSRIKHINNQLANLPIKNLTTLDNIRLNKEIKTNFIPFFHLLKKHNINLQKLQLLYEKINCEDE